MRLFTLLILIVAISNTALANNPNIFMVGDVEETYGGTAFELKTSKGVYTLTNAHICKNHTVLFGYFDNPLRLKLLMVRAIYTKHDLCLLSGLPSYPGLTLANDYTLGQVFTVEGFPKSEHRITTGFINQYDTSPKMYLKYTSAIDHGNSGSPVIDHDGNVVGVISGVYVDSHMGAAVPLEFIKDFLTSQHVYP